MNNIQKAFKTKSMLRKMAKDDDVNCMADGGKVQGPGGPTADKVPAMLSHGEYVLPADTVQAVGADKLDALRNATHAPAPPVGGTGGTPARRRSALRLADGGPVGFDPNLDPILEMQKRAQQVHAADANFAAQPRLAPQAPPRVPLQVNVPNNTGYGASTPTPAELHLRQAANAERAGLPPYPQEATQASEISRAEFDAARAAANPGAAASETSSLGARVASGAEASASKLRAGLSAVGSAAKAPFRALGGLARGLGTAAVVAPAAYQTVAGAGDSNYDQRFGYHPPTGADYGLKPGSTAENLATSALRLPMDIGGAATDFAANAANTAVHMFPGTSGIPQIGFADQGRMRNPAADPVGTAANPGVQIIDPSNPASMAITPPSANATGGNGNLYRTHDGRQGYLPPGIEVRYDAKGNPVFAGGQGPQSQALLQGSSAAQGSGEDPVASALRSMLGNQSTSASMINSRSGDINRHFDDLAKQIQDLHGSAHFHANGELASQLLELEKARAGALGQDQGNLVGSQGNVVSDASSLRGQQNNALDGMVQRANNNDSTTSATRNALIGHQFDALKMRQEASDKALAAAQERANALFTDPKTGKVDAAKAAQYMDDFTRNYGGAIDGSQATTGDARGSMAEAALHQAVNDDRNTGSNNPTAAPVSVLRNPHTPGIGELLDHNSNVGLGDYVRGKLDVLPYVDSGDVYDTNTGDKVRARKLTVDQRKALRDRGILKDN